VLTAGAWMSQLLGDLFSLSVERVPVFWFEPRAPIELPVYLLDDSDGMFYGFPCFADQGLKVARHHSGVTCSPDTVKRELAPGEDEEVRRFLRRRLPSIANARLLGGKVCMYTNTNDGHFVIDRHPASPRAIYASACSGHGFKFASVVGEILADLALDGGTRYPIGFLSAARFQ
jgi:sarcosine oxidase